MWWNGLLNGGLLFWITGHEVRVAQVWMMGQSDTWTAPSFYVLVRAVRSLYIHHQSLAAPVTGSAHGVGTDASASQHIRPLLERGFARCYQPEPRPGVVWHHAHKARDEPIRLESAEDTQSSTPPLDRDARVRAFRLATDWSLGRGWARPHREGSLFGH